MAVYANTFETAQTGVALIAAVPGKTILITRVLLSCADEVAVTLLSDPLGENERTVIPAQHVGVGQVVQAVLGREFALPADVRQSVGFTSDYAATESALTIILWYEVVG